MKPTEIQTRFAENLKKIRKNRKMTQFQLAEKSGLSEAMIKAVELSNSWPSERTITQIAEALDIDVYHFFLPVPASIQVNHEVEEKVRKVIEESFSDFVVKTGQKLMDIN